MKKLLLAALFSLLAWPAAAQQFLIDSNGGDASDTVNHASRVNCISGCSGGTAYTEDAASAADPVGGQIMARRRDSLATETTTDGDVTAVNSTAKGELYVKQVDPVAVTQSGSWSLTANQSVNIAQINGVTPLMGNGATGTGSPRVTIANDNSPLAVTQSGTWNIGTVTTLTSITNTVTTSDTSTLVDNAAFTDGTTRVGMAGYIFDEVAGTALTENDAAAARIDSKRAVVGVIEDATTRGRRATVSAGGALLTDASATTQPVSIAATVTVAGAKTNNNAAPGATNVGALIALANASAPSWSEGNEVLASVDLAGNMRVLCSNCSGSSPSIVDNAAFTDGTTSIAPIGFIFDEVAGTALTENDAAAARIDAKRAVVGVLEDATTRGQRAAVSAAGRLSVDASGVAVPVTDNSGSLTVDAPVGTPVFVRLSDGAASLIGQKTMANSLPVVIASDQSAISIAANSSVNVAQFGGTNVSTGTGASGAGIPRVTVANDSNILATQSGTWNIGTVTTVTTVSTLTSITNNVNVVGTKTNNNAVPGATNIGTLPALANAATPSWTEGNQVALSVDLSGRMRVLGAIDNAAFTAGTTQGGIAMDIVDDTPGTGSNTAEDQAGATRMTTNRAEHVNIRDSAGQELGSALPSKATLPVQVQQVATLSIISGAARLRGVQMVAQPEGALLPAKTSPSVDSVAQVVALSPNPSLQCPYVATINQTAATRIVQNPGGKYVHICTVTLVSAGAQNVSLVEGTGTTCGTAGTGLIGGTTASVALAANGGLVIGSDRITVPMQKLGDDVCVAQSAANNVSGTLSYGLY